MKIAKLKSTPIQTEAPAIINNYFSVDDDYDFLGNNSEDVTDENTTAIFQQASMSSVAGWQSLIKKNSKDYAYMRDFAKANFLPNWSGLTSNEQKILVKYYIYSTTTTQDDIDSFYTTDEQINNWTSLAQLSLEARNSRWEAARQKVSFYLTQMQTLQLYQATKSYTDDYIYANLPYLTCWLFNTAYAPLGINFTSNGFSAQTYYSVTVKNICYDIIINGNY